MWIFVFGVWCVCELCVNCVRDCGYSGRALSQPLFVRHEIENQASFSGSIGRELSQPVFVQQTHALLAHNHTQRVITVCCRAVYKYRSKLFRLKGGAILIHTHQTPNPQTKQKNRHNIQTRTPKTKSIHKEHTRTHTPNTPHANQTHTHTHTQNTKSTLKPTTNTKSKHKRSTQTRISARPLKHEKTASPNFFTTIIRCFVLMKRVHLPQFTNQCKIQHCRVAWLTWLPRFVLPVISCFLCFSKALFQSCCLRFLPCVRCFVCCFLWFFHVFVLCVLCCLPCCLCVSPWFSLCLSLVVFIHSLPCCIHSVLSLICLLSLPLLSFVSPFVSLCSPLLFFVSPLLSVYS